MLESPITIRFAYCIALLVFVQLLITPAPLTAATQTYSIAINCTSTAQLCAPSYTTTVTTASQAQLTVDFTSSSCSDIRVYISLDGVMQFTSPFLPRGGDTGLINLGIINLGSHTLAVQAEGEAGGCNPGLLASWSGTLTVSEAAALPTIRILPQLAFGGGWYTALYFTNTNSSPGLLIVSFMGNDGYPLTIPALGGSSFLVNLAARGTALIEAPNVGSLVQGYVTAALPTGVTGYGVLRQSVAGVPDQEAVVPLSENTVITSTLLFDDTKYVTGVAVVNLASANNTITAAARDKQGNSLGSASIPLGPNAKVALALRNIPGLASVAGTIGSVDFTSAIGNVAALGLRFNGAAFTSIPTADK